VERCESRGVLLHIGDPCYTPGSLCYTLARGIRGSGGTGKRPDMLVQIWNRLYTPCAFRFSLGRPWRRAVLVLVVAGLAAPLGMEAARIGFASVWLRMGDLPALRRARAADPRDPEVYDRLGQARLYDFEESDPQAALAEFWQATRLAPKRPIYWEDLALASESVRDGSTARFALSRAQYLDPMSPRVHWLAANYDLNSGEAAEALPQLRRVLELGPAYSQAVYELCLREGIGPRTVEAAVLPPGGEPVLELSYAAFLVTSRQLEAARSAWDRSLTGHQAFPFSLAEPYLDGLMQDKEYSMAFRAWQDLERAAVIPGHDASDPTQLIFNGSFERKPLNAGFDWRYGDVPYLTLDFADPAAHQGRRCLRMDFTAPSNRDFEPVYQDVAVEPNQAYELAASVRSDALTSGSGPRLRVVDLAQPAALDVSTGQTLGTTAWHEIQVRFSTGPETRFVQVAVWRPRCLGFPAQISGTLWVDEVSLKASG